MVSSMTWTTRPSASCTIDFRTMFQNPEYLPICISRGSARLRKRVRAASFLITQILQWDILDSGTWSGDQTSYAAWVRRKRPIAATTAAATPTTRFDQMAISPTGQPVLHGDGHSALNVKSAQMMSMML